jgi:hypothetical protein
MYAYRLSDSYTMVVDRFCVYERQSNGVRDINHLVLSSAKTRRFSIGNHCTTAAHIKADTQKACYSRPRNNVQGAGNTNYKPM